MVSVSVKFRIHLLISRCLSEQEATYKKLYSVFPFVSHNLATTRAPFSIDHHFENWCYLLSLTPAKNLKRGEHLNVTLRVERASIRRRDKHHL